MPAFFDLALPLLRALPPETAHRVTIRALAAGLAPRRRRRRSAEPRVQAVADAISQSGRARRGLRQACRGAGRDAGLRLRLRRDRHGDAAAAAGQSAAAPFPPGRGPGAHQPLRLQQRGAGGGGGAAARAARQARHRRRQYRQEPRHAGRYRRLCAGRGAAGAARRLSHHQRVVAQHAGPAQSAAQAAR